jgi:hypothetical protein
MEQAYLKYLIKRFMKRLIENAQTSLKIKLIIASFNPDLSVFE